MSQIQIAVGDQPQPLRGAIAVVTGSSSGLGKQIVLDFAAAGCRQMVVHFHRNRVAADAAADTLKLLDVDVVIEQADFAKAESAAEFVDRVFTKWPTINTWVHCAGADVLTGQAADWSFDEKLRHLIDVDLIGSIRVGRDVAERMCRRAAAALQEFPPSITLIGWDQSNEGMEGAAGQMFAPVKAGVEAFAKSLAQDAAPHVRVNTISPGWIRTAWGEQSSDYWNRRAADQSLMNRWGTPADVAAAATFLATPTHSFMTGQTITVNGGWNRRHRSG